MVLLLISWYVYAIYGNILVISDNEDKHCFVAAGSDTPLDTIPDDAQVGTYQDVA